MLRCGHAIERIQNKLCHIKFHPFSSLIPLFPPCSLMKFQPRPHHVDESDKR